MHKRILYLTFFCLLSIQLVAQDSGSGLDFLNIGPSTQLLSLGEATTATPTGASAIYTNPALLVQKSGNSAEASYTLWVSDVYNQFAAVNLVKERYALGFGVYNSQSSGFEARDNPGDAAGTFNIGYLSLAAAGAYKFGPVSAGITAQYLREEVFQFRANGYALSGGLLLNLLDERVRIGAALQNLGEMEALNEISTDLPATFRAGIKANLIRFVTPGVNDFPVLLSIHTEYIRALEDLSRSDYTSSDDGDDFFIIAMSAEAANLFYLQGGYKFGPTERPFSIGAGLNVDPISVHYALVPFSTGFGTVHSIGVQYYF